MNLLNFASAILLFHKFKLNEYSVAEMLELAGGFRTGMLVYCLGKLSHNLVSRKIYLKARRVFIKK